LLFNQQEFAIIRTDFSKGGIYFIEEGEEILLLDQRLELVDKTELKMSYDPIVSENTRIFGNCSLVINMH
tara:strand:- start:644 stop:853 length:210 start_codon:yes stop_codon:yes gene_type:complete